MHGKKIKLNDYQLKYTKNIICLDVYSVFLDKKNNKIIVYSYDNENIYFGNYFFRNDNAIIMKFKTDEAETVKDFINNILNNKDNSKYKIISLDNINSIQIIDEHKLDNFNCDINKLSELTIPKVKQEIKVVSQQKEKKPFKLIYVFLIIFSIITLIFISFKLSKKEDSYFICEKDFSLKSIPTKVEDKIKLTFNKKNIIINIDKKTNYKFTNEKYFNKFVKENDYYKYLNEGDSYKIDNEKQMFKLFSNTNISNNIFLPKRKNSLIKYYQNEKYICKEVDKDE